MKSLEELIKELPPRITAGGAGFRSVLVGNQSAPQPLEAADELGGSLVGIPTAIHIVELQRKALEWWGD